MDRVRMGHRLIRAPFGLVAVTLVIALGCLACVVVGYNSLPREITVTRWSTATKSPFVALRVPLINLLTVVGLGVVWTVYDHAQLPRRAGVSLMTAAAIKSICEAVELLTVPDEHVVLAVLVGAGVLGGLGVAVVASRRWLAERRWTGAQWAPHQTVVAVGALAGIVGLNIAAFV